MNAGRRASQCGLRVKFIFFIFLMTLLHLLATNIIFYHTILLNQLHINGIDPILYPTDTNTLYGCFDFDSLNTDYTVFTCIKFVTQITVLYSAVLASMLHNVRDPGDTKWISGRIVPMQFDPQC